MSRFRAFALLALVGAFSAASLKAPAAVGANDPLTRAEFDQELTIQFKQADVVSVFRLFAKVTRVPFVLDFEEDSELRLTLDAKNMNARAILASLAGTYDLAFAMSSAGVVVRRVGGEPTGSPITVGAWPQEVGAAYRLVLQIRGPQKNVLSRVPVTARVNQVASIKQGLEGDGRALLFDAERGLAEPSYLPGIEVRIYPKGEGPGGLELLMELVRSRVLDTNRYVQERRVETKVVGEEGTVVFRTDDGYEIAVTDWTADDQLKQLQRIRKE